MPLKKQFVLTVFKCVLDEQLNICVPPTNIAGGNWISFMPKWYWNYNTPPDLNKQSQLLHLAHLNTCRFLWSTELPTGTCIVKSGEKGITPAFAHATGSVPARNGKLRLLKWALSRTISLTSSNILRRGLLFITHCSNGGWQMVSRPWICPPDHFFSCVQ